MKSQRWSLALLLGAVSCSSQPPASRPTDPTAQPPAVSSSDPAALLARYTAARDTKDAAGFSHEAEVLAEVIAPLTQVCADPATPPEVRSRIVETLAPTNDKRALACVAEVVRALEAATKDASFNVSEASARAALGFAAAVHDPSLHDPVFSVFESETRSDGAKRLREPLAAALVALAKPSDVARLVARIERPLPTQEDEATDDELFRQSTAIAALERCQDESAIAPLVRVILSPRKRTLHAGALLALSQLAVPATAALVKLLRGEDATQRAFAEAHALDLVAPDARTALLLARAKNAHVVSAAESLSALGRNEALGALMETMDKADPTTKAALAATMPGFPVSPLAMTVFRKATEATGLDVELPNGAPAKPALLRVSLRFYDPTLVHWILQTAKAQRGKPERVDEVRVAALETATLLMRPEHTKLVLEFADLTRLVDARRKLGSGAEKLGSDLANECKADAACYTNVASAPVTSDATRLRVQKSIVLLRASAPANAASDLMKLLPRLEDASVAALACDALTHATSFGSQSFARDVEALAKKRAGERRAEATPLALCAAKLRARAGR